MPLLTDFEAEHVAGSECWVVTSDLVYRDRRNQTYIAPAGLVTDLFSIPGPLRGILFRSQKYVESAVLHDAAYRHELLTIFALGKIKAQLTRSQADALLRDSMRDQGAPWTLWSLIYAGVRVGGWRSYKA